jgi:hypothetical protein
MPTGPRNDRLSKAEIRKDALQDGVTAASNVVGSVATILTTAVSDVARAMGGFATEIFEIRDSARRARQDHELDQDLDDDRDHDEVVVTKPAKPSKASKPAKPTVSVVKDLESDDQPKES